MRHFIPALALLALGAACVPRVRLPEPPSEYAPLPARLAAYKDLQPASSIVVSTLSQYAAPYGTGYSYSTGSLALRGGWRIYDPRDLLTVVREDSPTARYTHGWSGKESIASPGIFLSGTGIIVGGLAMMAGLLANPILFLGGLGVVVVSSAAALVFAIISRSAADDLNAAFGSYQESLLQRLRLTPEDLESEKGGRPTGDERKPSKILYHLSTPNPRPGS
jgi:hypothetical protein